MHSPHREMQTPHDVRFSYSKRHVNRRKGDRRTSHPLISSGRHCTVYAATADGVFNNLVHKETVMIRELGRVLEETKGDPKPVPPYDAVTELNGINFRQSA